MTESNKQDEVLTVEGLMALVDEHGTLRESAGGSAAVFERTAARREREDAESLFDEIRAYAAALATQAQQGEADLRKRFVDWWDTTHGDTKGPAFKAIAWEAVQGVATPSAPARQAALTDERIKQIAVEICGMEAHSRTYLTRFARAILAKAALTIGEPAELPKEPTHD